MAFSLVSVYILNVITITLHIFVQFIQYIDVTGVAFFLFVCLIRFLVEWSAYQECEC